jgi:hypothetical protein
MMTQGMSSGERRVREQISAEWGCFYTPLDDYALPGVGGTITGGALAAATQHLIDTFVHAIARREREPVPIAQPKREVVRAVRGGLVPIHSSLTPHKAGNSRAAMSRR